MRWVTRQYDFRYAVPNGTADKVLFERTLDKTLELHDAKWAACGGNKYHLKTNRQAQAQRYDHCSIPACLREALRQRRLVCALVGSGPYGLWRARAAYLLCTAHGCWRGMAPIDRWLRIRFRLRSDRNGRNDK